MHVHNGFGPKKARLEIIPLIDVMFFLLAAFMLVSLSMATTKTVKVNLPTAQSGDPDTAPQIIAITVDTLGGIYVDKRPVAKGELLEHLKKARESNPKARVLISGDLDSRHGNVIAVLDRVRLAGIQNVAFQTRDPDNRAP
jgi:biopolymer transport protein ExbD